MLELKNICFCVDGLDILKGVNLKVDDNAFTVITGPNGGGKSTLARIIMGIEKPTSGQIIFDGKDITDLSVTERAKIGIGYAFQQPPRFKGLTVRRLLSLAHGSELPVDECCAYLTNVGLCSKEYLNREVDTSLSGGEVKRIEIATLMARDLKLSIFDEPEAGIDLWSFSMLIDSFKSSIKAKTNSILIISHQERIMQLANKLVIVADGKIRTSGTYEEVFPQIMAEFNSSCEFRNGGENNG